MTTAVIALSAKDQDAETKGVEHDGRAAAPRSIADCADVPLGKDRTPYSAWAAANAAAFGIEDR
jgi:hypothetical protein